MPPSLATFNSREPRPLESLQPVGSTTSTHDAIDLSAKAYVLVGRSPSCDLRLAEPTCSRKHALIFHHPNGSCYVVDCGSAHGTFVDGVKVEAPAPAKEGEKATAAPHRVRKGALLRFGGPDGPTFVLRSFPASLEGLVRGLAGEKGGSVGLPIVRADGGSCSPAVAPRAVEGTPSFLPTLAPTTPRISKGSSPCSPASALVALNTRLNALGGGAHLSQCHLKLAREAASKIVVPSTDKEQLDYCLQGNNNGGSTKRFREMNYHPDMDCPESPVRLIKRFRSATFPLSPEPTALGGGCLKIPEAELVTPLVSQDSLSTLEEDLRKLTRRRVKFQDEMERIYPASVTPELQIGSFDEEHFASLQM